MVKLFDDIFNLKKKQIIENGDILFISVETRKEVIFGIVQKIFPDGISGNKRIRIKTLTIPSIESQ